MNSFNVYFPFSMRSIHPFFSSRERITHNTSFWIFVVLKTFSIVKTLFCQFFKYANSHSYALSLTANFVIVGASDREKLLTSFCYFSFLLNHFPHSVIFVSLPYSTSSSTYSSLLDQCSGFIPYCCKALSVSGLTVCSLSFKTP